MTKLLRIERKDIGLMNSKSPLTYLQLPDKCEINYKTLHLLFQLSSGVYLFKEKRWGQVSTFDIR